MEIDNLIDSLFGSQEGVWAAIKKFALLGSREATRMMLQMYYCLKSPQTPSLDKVIIVGGLGYQLLPKDALPVGKYKLLGLLDNGITLALAYSKVQSNVTPQIANQVEAVLAQWFPEGEDARSPQAPLLPGAPTFPKVVPSASGEEAGDGEDDLVVD